jgi:hypothetical protein
MDKEQGELNNVKGYIKGRANADADFARDISLQAGVLRGQITLTMIAGWVAFYVVDPYHSIPTAIVWAALISLIINQIYLELKSRYHKEWGDIADEVVDKIESLQKTGGLTPLKPRSLIVDRSKLIAGLDIFSYIFLAYGVLLAILYISILK